MAINEWWASDPDERYWLEVTDRESLGSNVIAPKLAAGGKETPTYTLVSHVKPGDVVFHWWKAIGQQPAIVGSSTVAGDAFDSTLVWQAHGTFGRSRSGPSKGDAWEAPLIGFAELDEPVTLDVLRILESPLRAIRDQLARDHTGPLYFPYAFSDKRPLRTGQGYLFKLPAAILELLPAMASRRTPVPAQSTPLSNPRRGTAATRRKTDPALRRAIERHAMRWALEHFEAEGFLVDDVGDTESFDVYAVDSALAELHIEVKGSSSTSVTVNLTDGEVKHWGPDYERVLVVVDQIKWERDQSGSYETSGGRARIWRHWEIEAEALEPTEYRYTLPPSSTSLS